jgi:hypothetical protein
MAAAREAIIGGRFETFRADTEARLRARSDDDDAADSDGATRTPRVGRRVGSARIPGTLGRRG